MIRQSSGKYNIIDSGMAMTYGPEDGVELVVNLENKLEFALVISFDGIEEESKININVDEKTNSIKMVFYDDKRTLGYGIERPLEIAQIEDKKVFLRIWISPMGRESRAKKIEYIFFKEK